MIRFSDMIADIIQKKHTGLLSLVATNGKYHVKIFFSEGEVYYLLYGDVKNADCIAACQTLEFSDCFFTSGVKVAASEKCTLATSRIIDELRKRFDKVPSRQSSVSDIPEKLKVAMVRQIGPIGEMVFQAVVDQWQASSPPTKQQVLQLVNLIGERIEDEKSRREFLDEAKSIIS